MGFSASNDKAAGSGNWQVGNFLGGNSMSNEPCVIALVASRHGPLASGAQLQVLQPLEFWRDIFTKRKAASASFAV